MIVKGGSMLLTVIGIIVTVSVLNKWHPVMGLGDVVYFVTCGVVVGHILNKQDKKE